MPTVGYYVDEENTLTHKVVYRACDDPSKLLDLHDRDPELVVFAADRDECAEQLRLRYPDVAENYGRYRPNIARLCEGKDDVVIWRKPMYRIANGSYLSLVDMFNIRRLVGLLGMIRVPTTGGEWTRTILMHLPDCVSIKHNRFDIYFILKRDQERRDKLNLRLTVEMNEIGVHPLVGCSRAVHVLCSLPPEPELLAALREYEQELRGEPAHTYVMEYMKSIPANQKLYSDAAIREVVAWLELQKSRKASSPR